MAFTDPQTITVATVAQTMPRIETNGQKSVYQKADQTFTFTISHQNAPGNRVRSLTKFEEKAVVPDPLTSVNDYEHASIQLVIDRPLAGFSQTRIDQLVQGFKSWLTTTAVGQLYGRES
jgi:hypothetical protein